MTQQSQQHIQSIQPSIPVPAQSTSTSIFSLLTNPPTYLEKNAPQTTPSLDSKCSGDLAASLTLNLKLPPAISSILFKKTVQEPSAPPQRALPNTPFEGPKDPRHQSISKTPTAQKPTIHTKESETTSQNPVFNKIQNILTNGIKPASNYLKPKPKNKYITAQTSGYTIMRSKPNEQFIQPEVKSQLVELYEKETPDTHECTEFTILSAYRQNYRLEKLISHRNTTHLNKIKHLYETNEFADDVNEMFDDFLGHSDLLNSFNSLMNYDFCRNKFNPNKANKKKKIKKVRTKSTFQVMQQHESQKIEELHGGVTNSENLLYADLDVDTENGIVESKLDVELQIKSKPINVQLEDDDYKNHDFELKTNFKEEDNGDISESEKEHATNKKPKTSDSSYTSMLSKVNENKITIRETKSVERKYEHMSDRQKSDSRSKSPRRFVHTENRSSKSDNTSRNENRRRSRSRSRSRSRDKSSASFKANYSKSRSESYNEKKSTQKSFSTKYSNSTPNKTSSSNRDMPLRQSQETNVNKNFKRKRHD